MTRMICLRKGGIVRAQARVHLNIHRNIFSNIQNMEYIDYINTETLMTMAKANYKPIREKTQER